MNSKYSEAEKQAIIDQCIAGSKSVSAISTETGIAVPCTHGSNSITKFRKAENRNSHLKTFVSLKDE